MKFKLFTWVLLSVVLLGGYAEAKTPKKPAPAKAAEGSIAWVNNLADGLTQAKASNKPVMADFYAGWCGWCKKLDKEVYTNPAVIALAKDFVAVKVDTDKYGQDSTKYGVQGLPTIVFMNPDGTVIDKIVGYNPAPAFAERMKKSLKK